MLKRVFLAAMLIAASTHARADTTPDGYKLEQVLILSRHSIRAPLSNNGSVLSKITNKTWPEWEVPGGNLTMKGGVLEIYMGRYIADWLTTRGLLTKDACPTAASVYTFANSLQRTVATAQYFLAGAFPGCDVTVHHQAAMGTMDPTFNPSFTDDNGDFLKKATDAMDARSKTWRVGQGYGLLETILDYKHSQSCQTGKLCDLSKGSDSFTAKKGAEPGTDGPLKIGNSAIDAFTLQYYEGFPANQIAWGKIKGDQQWASLAAVKNAYQDSLFAAPDVARNVATPMRTYIRNAFVQQGGEAKPKVTLMFGHDSNIASLLASLDCEPYQLPGQDERTPIGGNLQFQRWRDTKANRDLFRLDYVYQTKMQLREGTKLSAKNPPKRVTLSLKGCNRDADGFCAWSDFAHAME